MIVLTLMKVAEEEEEEEDVTRIVVASSVTFTFHPKERSFRAALHSFRSGEGREGKRETCSVGCHIKEGRKARRQEGIWHRPATSHRQPWHVLLKDGGVFELDPF